MPTPPADFLPLAGNDIVDLRNRDSHFSNIHPRFFEKVFTPAERAFVAGTKKIFFYWAMWAGKEAAYKYMVQKVGHLAFAHKEFEVDNDFSRVTFRGHNIPLRLFYHPTFVYALTNMEENAQKFFFVSYICCRETWKKNLAYNIQWQKILELVQAQNPTIANEFSWAVRVLAIAILAQSFSLDPLALEIKNLPIARTRIPAAFYHGQILPIRISFTHHGDFFAVHFAGSQTDVDFTPLPDDLICNLNLTSLSPPSPQNLPIKIFS